MNYRFAAVFYRFAAVFTFCLSAFQAAYCLAGGGPENIFLVVNSADGDSLAIANYYIDVRRIPPTSVFYVDWPAPPFDTEIGFLREKLLKPVLDEIKRRKLEDQIDYVIYSSGFPYAINFSGDLQQSPPHPVASLTGLTFLHEDAMAGASPRLFSPLANSYAAGLLHDSPTQGFRARYRLDAAGKRIESDVAGQHYYLSTMLGYTGGKRNNTRLEVIRYLMSAAKADGTRPQGSIYFVQNPDIRSTTRQKQFQPAVDALRRLGVNAEIIQGANDNANCLPRNKQDVMGAVVGFAKPDLTLAKSRLLPGSIVDNFTSYGGRMSGHHSQTLLSHFLKYGAAAASGTVAEPFANAPKFPNSRLFVHYASGCNVAESFYQSLLSPYQMLIVGDPLCQPWAVPPTVKIRGLNTRKRHSGNISFQVEARSEQNHQIRSIETYIDGKLVQRTLPGDPIQLDTRKVNNGYHELRVVAVEDTPIETQGRQITGFVTSNHPPTEDSANEARKPLGVASAVTPSNALWRIGSPGFVRVKSTDATEIRLYRGRDAVGSIKGSKGRITVDTRKLGAGTVELRAVAFHKDRSIRPIFGFPIKVEIVDIK